MRIAHVLSSLDMGGQERVALDLAEGQAALGHQLLTIALDAGEGPLRDEFEAKGVEVVSAPKSAGGFDFDLWRRLAGVMRDRRLDVVHTHNPVPLFYAAVPAKLARAALVHTKHGINPSSARRTWMKRGFGVLVDRFVCVSESTAETARVQRECRRGRIEVVLNGIDLSRFSPSDEVRAAVRAELGIPSSAFVVGTVGRIYPEKAHSLLLRALEPVLGDDLHVVIIGDGPDAGAIADQARGMARGDAVHLLGIRRDIPRVLPAFDVFVLSSTNEGLPLVIPEAMASKLPVVATSVGGVPKVVLEGATGFLVDSGDADALRERVLRLRDDPELCRSMAERGRKVALDEYSSARMVRDYLEIYEAVLR